MHPFDAAIQLAPSGKDRFAGSVASAYANMVGSFGGITNAVMLNAVMSHPERFGDPIALTVNFANPVADGDFEIQASPARTNRSTQHWWITMVQAGEVATTATVVLAQRRDTWSTNEAMMPGGLPSPGDLPRAPTVGRPAWVARYDMRFVDGGLAEIDGREQSDSLTRLWIRDDPPRPLTFTSLTASAGAGGDRLTDNLLSCGRIPTACASRPTRVRQCACAHIQERLLRSERGDLER